MTATRTWFRGFEGVRRHAVDYFDAVVCVERELLVRRGDAYVDSQSAEDMKMRRGSSDVAGRGLAHIEIEPSTRTCNYWKRCATAICRPGVPF